MYYTHDHSSIIHSSKKVEATQVSIDGWIDKENVGYDFPRGTVVKNPPANAGDMGSIPWSGKIPHAAEQLSLCATASEPAL